MIWGSECTNIGLKSFMIYSLFPLKIWLLLPYFDSWVRSFLMQLVYYLKILFAYLFIVFTSSRYLKIYLNLIEDSIFVSFSKLRFEQLKIWFFDIFYNWINFYINKKLIFDNSWLLNSVLVSNSKNFFLLNKSNSNRFFTSSFAAKKKA